MPLTKSSKSSEFEKSYIRTPLSVLGPIFPTVNYSGKFRVTQKVTFFQVPILVILELIYSKIRQFRQNPGEMPLTEIAKKSKNQWFFTKNTCFWAKNRLFCVFLPFFVNGIFPGFASKRPIFYKFAINYRNPPFWDKFDQIAVDRNRQNSEKHVFLH